MFKIACKKHIFLNKLSLCTQIDKGDNSDQEIQLISLSPLPITRRLYTFEMRLFFQPHLLYKVVNCQ
jgi:hypothetical protein